MGHAGRFFPPGPLPEGIPVGFCLKSRAAGFISGLFKVRLVERPVLAGGRLDVRMRCKMHLRIVLCAAPAVPKIPWGPRPSNWCCCNLLPIVFRLPCMALSWKSGTAAWRSPWWQEVRLLMRCIWPVARAVLRVGVRCPFCLVTASGALQATAAGLHLSRLLCTCRSPAGPQATTTTALWSAGA